MQASTSLTAADYSPQNCAVTHSAVEPHWTRRSRTRHAAAQHAAEQAAERVEDRVFGGAPKLARPQRGQLRDGGQGLRLRAGRLRSKRVGRSGRSTRQVVGAPQRSPLRPVARAGRARLRHRAARNGRHLPRGPQRAPGTREGSPVSALPTADTRPFTRVD